MSQTAYGVRLPFFKLRLFWYIEKHPGRSGEDLAQHFEKKRGCIAAHVFQLNDLFMNADIRIKGGRWTGYYVDKGKKP
jgi:hypothetical protein